MSAVQNYKITNEGRKLIAKALAGKNIKFTRMAVGDGSINLNVELEEFKSLVNEVLSVSVNRKTIIDETSVQIDGYFNNSQLEEGFFYRELGLFALDPNTDEEILYCYANNLEDAEYIPPISDNKKLKEKTIVIITTCGDSANIEISVNTDNNVSQDSLNDTLSEYQLIDEKGQPNGYAPLDDNAKVPAEHLPEQKRHTSFSPNSGSVDANGENNTVYQPNEAVIVTKSLPTFTSATEAANGKDGVTISPSGAYNIIGRNTALSLGYSVPLASRYYSIIATFLKPVKIKAYTVLHGGVSYQTWASYLGSMDASIDGTNWTQIVPPQENIDHVEEPLDLDQEYLAYRFNIAAASIALENKPHSLGALNLFWDEIVDSGTNEVVLRASEETPFVYTTASDVTREQKTSLSLTLAETCNIAINDGRLEAIGDIYRQTTQPQPKVDSGTITTLTPAMTSYTAPKGTVTYTGTWGDGTNKRYAYKAIGADTGTIAQQRTTDGSITYVFSAISPVGNYLVNLTTSVYIPTQGGRGAYTNRIVKLVYEDDTEETVIANNEPQLGVNGTKETLSVIFSSTKKVKGVKFEGVTTLSANLNNGANINSIEVLYSDANITPIKENSIWLKRLEPIRSFKFSSSQWQEYDGVPIAFATMQADVITGVETAPYNYNGIGKKLIKFWSNDTSWYDIYLKYDQNDKKIKRWIEQGGECAKLTTINYPIEFAEKPKYLAVPINTGTYSGALDSRYTTPSTVSTTGFTLPLTVYTAFSSRQWIAKGY